MMKIVYKRLLLASLVLMGAVATAQIMEKYRSEA